ncbi:MAG: DUF1512 domain-containing protein [Candidatus Bathyarchaeota archaeon]
MIYLASFFFFMVYGQKFQTWLMLREIENAVIRLKVFKDEFRQIAIKTLKEASGDKIDPTPRIDQFLEYFIIMPQNLDPAGIVPKLDHLIDVSDQRLKDEVKIILPTVDQLKSTTMEGVLGVAINLNEIYRVVNHFYLTGKKNMSLYVIMQIQMQLPLILQLAGAMSVFGKAFVEGHPVGDGAGSLVAARMMYGKEKRTIAKDIVSAETNIEGRRVLVLKTEGPGVTVGKPGDGIKNLLEECEGKVAAVIMVDAKGKYEGEKSGGTVEGVGSAIGGTGVDAFVIEEITLKYKIPIYAVGIKESIEEAMAPMTKSIFEGVDIAVAKVRRIILEETHQGDTIIVAGIGNTVGIGQ